MNIEDKEFMEKYILNNPFEFKQGIISHCREMDKIDVYNWVAEDELKIDKLQQENKKYKEAIDKAINNSQYWIDYYTKLNSDERIALRLQENIDILKQQRNY